MGHGKQNVLCHRASHILIVLTSMVAGCGGGSSVPAPTQAVTNAVPAIANLTPSSAVAGSGDLSITVAGNGFVSGSSVQFNGTALKTTFTSAAALAATVPAADLTNGSIAAVTVSSPSPGGGVSAAATFTVDNPQPVVKSIDPASVMAGSSGTTIDIAGAGFVPSSVCELERRGSLYSAGQFK